MIRQPHQGLAGPNQHQPRVAACTHPINQSKAGQVQPALIDWVIDSRFSRHIAGVAPQL